jgi:hypothetical protein
MACGIVAASATTANASARQQAPQVPSSLDQQQQPLDAKAKTDGRRCLAAQLLEQAVVAAAAAHGALRAEMVGDPLVDGEVVVVHPAHHARVDAVGQPGRIERRAHRIEVRQ